MAIQNASDLLVYKNATAVAQVTKITVAATPLDGAGTIKVDNVTNGSDVTSDDVTVPLSGTVANTQSDVADAIRAVLIANGYTASAVSSGVFTATNGATGYVPTLSFKDGTAVIDDGGITVEVVTYGSDAGYEPVAFSTSASFSINNELIDTTNKDSSGWSNSQSGLKNFEISTEALQDFEANLDFQEMFNDIGSTTAVTVRFAQRDTGGGSDKYYQGSAFISSLSMEAGVEDNATYSVTLTGTASVTEGTD